MAEQDPRDPNDPARLAEEARAQLVRHAGEIRGATVPAATEPPTAYGP